MTVFLCVEIQESFKAQWTENPCDFLSEVFCMKTSLVAIAISVPGAFLLGSLSFSLSLLCCHPCCAVSRNLPFLSKRFPCPYHHRCRFFPQPLLLSTPSPLEDNTQLCPVPLDLPACKSISSFLCIVFGVSVLSVKRQQTSMAFIVLFSPALASF